MPYTRPPYKLIKGVVGGGVRDDFTRSPPCFTGGDFGKKLFASSMGITNFGDRDLVMSQIVSALRIFNAAFNTEGSWGFLDMRVCILAENV